MLTKSKTFNNYKNLSMEVVKIETNNNIHFSNLPIFKIPVLKIVSTTQTLTL